MSSLSILDTSTNFLGDPLSSFTFITANLYKDYSVFGCSVHDKFVSFYELQYLIQNDT